MYAYARFLYHKYLPLMLPNIPSIILVHYETTTYAQIFYGKWIHVYFNLILGQREKKHSRCPYHYKKVLHNSYVIREKK